MAKTRKELGVEQLKRMFTRWANEDTEFRQYMSWRLESLKLIGAGNGSGLLAVAVFLTTGTRSGGLVGGAKWCLTLFAIGIAAFVLAYRTLYKCSGSIEDGLIALRHGDHLESQGVKRSASKAIDESERSGILVLIATACFVLGMTIGVLGLLFG